jgi:phosphoribosylformylglycinamidine synthase
VKGEHVVIDGDDWGKVSQWKQQYDAAIEANLA